jgi:hypothetical protein
MRTLAVCVAALAVSAGTAAAALPRTGLFVPGRSLGGIHLGETQSAVRTALGPAYGVCLGCRARTWYFTYRRFDQHGLAVEFARGAVSAIYTLWMPPGWRATNGLELGVPDGQITTTTQPLVSVACNGYAARVADSATARSVYYVAEDKLWGFGLVPRRANPCR